MAHAGQKQRTALPRDHARVNEDKVRRILRDMNRELPAQLNEGRGHGRAIDEKFAVGEHLIRGTGRSGT
jgi:hypothetical protein